MKRFYASAEVVEEAGEFSVALDGRPVRTPGKRVLAVPTHRLAEAIAGEWRAQGDDIKPSNMQLTRLANTAIDRVQHQKAAVVTEVARFAETDLICYRTDEPADLRIRQTEAWQPLEEWVEQRWGVTLQVVTGLLPENQSEAALSALREVVDGYDLFTLTALHAATTICGSLIIALAIADGRLGAEDAWDRSQIDEAYQIEKWGEDAEMEIRRSTMHAELLAAATFMDLGRV